MCGTCGGHGAQDGDTTAHSSSRIIVVGKGGVGKSTLSAVLARLLALRGYDVLAVDADEQRNLGVALGMAPSEAAGVVAVAEDAGYVEEKTGARPGEGQGSMLRLNPDTADVVARCSVVAAEGVRLLVMGGVRRAGSGCLCPETALLAAAVGGMRTGDADVVIMDTHAGVEHFGRALARGFGTAIVVVEPTFTSVQVGLESARMSIELGIEDVHLVVNRTFSDADVARALEHAETLGGFAFTSVTSLPHDELVRTSEPSVGPLLEGSRFARAAAELLDTVVGVRHLFEALV
jgi:CO dehydrogenase maturation factor